MSVNQKHYVMVGIDLMPKVKEMDEDELDVFFDEMEDFTRNTGLKFIYDGMSGEYCFIGHVLNKGDEYDGMSPKIHHFASDLTEVREIVKETLKNISATEPSLISFTHWH